MSSLDPDTGCRDCGTTDRTHLPDCKSRAAQVQRAVSRFQDELRANAGAIGAILEGRVGVGGHCDVCLEVTGNAACRYGNCVDCGGHSEHNWGCVQTATAP